jgi:hypothetical protein
MKRCRMLWKHINHRRLKPRYLPRWLACRRPLALRNIKDVYQSVVIVRIHNVAAELRTGLEFKQLPSRCSNCKSVECYSERRRATPTSKCLACTRCKDVACNEDPCMVDLSRTESHREYLKAVKKVKELVGERRNKRDRKRYEQRKSSETVE